MYPVQDPDFAVYYAVAEILHSIDCLYRLVHVVEEEGYALFLAVPVCLGAVNVYYDTKVGVVKAAKVAVIVTSGPGVEVYFSFH